MNVAKETQRGVEDRAAGRCEYGRMHQSLQGATFHVEHVLPRSLGGQSDLSNLSWACPGCNLRKADRVGVRDPATGGLVHLFNPRSDRWIDHCGRDGFRVAPLRAIGRATVEALDLNHERRVRIREAESLFDLFPPDDK